jgi:hypothetical protein
VPCPTLDERVDRDFIRIASILALNSDDFLSKCQHHHKICTSTVAQYEFFDTITASVLWQFYKETPAVYRVINRQLYYLSGKIINTNQLHWWQALSLVGGLVANLLDRGLAHRLKAYSWCCAVGYCLLIVTYRFLVVTYWLTASVKLFT